MADQKLTVGELVYKISGDMDNLKAELKRTDTELKNMKNSMEKSGKATSSLRERFSKLKLAVVGFVTVALYKLKQGLSDAITNASELSESINAVNVVFGEGSDKITEFGKNAAESVGLANSEFNQMSTITGALLKDTGLSMSEVSDKTIDLTKRAADMASVFNTDVKDAMSAINQAIRGETEAIRRYAGNVTDAEIKTELLARGIDKSTTELTEQEKRLIRLDIIMKQTAVTQGDFAATSDEVANKARILKAQLKDKSAEIGQKLLPLYSKWLDLAGWLVDNIERLTSAVEILFKTIAAYVATSKLTSWATLAGNAIGLFAKGVATSTGLIGLKIKALIIYEAAMKRARTAAIALNVALGVLVGAAVLAATLIKKSAEKTAKAWEDAAQAQMDADDATLRLIKRNNRIKVLAQAGASKEVIELAEAQYDYSAALARKLTGVEMEEIVKRRDAARAAIKDNIKLQEEYSDIVNQVVEENTETQEEYNFAVSSGTSAQDKAKEAAEKAKQELESFQESMLSFIDESKNVKTALDNDLTNSFDNFSQSLKGNVQETVGSLAGLVIGAQDKIKELKETLKNTDDKDEKKNIKSQIEEQQRILDAREDYEERQASRIAGIRSKLEEQGIDTAKAGLDSLVNVRSLEEQIEEERRVASLDEFTRFEEEQAKKLLLLTDGLISEISIIKEKISTQEKFEADLTDYLKLQETSRLGNTEEWAQQTIGKYNEVANSLKSLLSTQTKVANIGSFVPSSISGASAQGQSTSQTVNNTNNNISAPVTISGQSLKNISAEEMTAILGFELNKRI